MSNFPASLALPLISIEPRKTLTYLGRRAAVLVEHHDKSRTGLRTITTEYIDEAAPENGGWSAGSVTRRTIKGDAWRKPESFEVIIEEALVA
jgi:hypothetical protein